MKITKATKCPSVLYAIDTAEREHFSIGTTEASSNSEFNALTTQYFNKLFNKKTYQQYII